MKARKAKYAAALAAVVLAAGAAAPYGKSELLTARHGDEFARAYRQSGMIDGIAYLKVVSYSGGHATVFYVTEAHSAGVRMDFSGGAGNWKLTDWNVVWSDSGSADGFCWPYYR